MNWHIVACFNEHISFFKQRASGSLFHATCMHDSLFHATCMVVCLIQHAWKLVQHAWTLSSGIFYSTRIIKFTKMHMQRRDFHEKYF